MSDEITKKTDIKKDNDLQSCLAIATTFYNMLTGAFPRDIRCGQDPIAVILSGYVVPIRKRDASIPAKVAEVIDRALEVNIKDRYQDAGEMPRAMQKAL